ncbi:MAG TPA: 2-oxoglutarate dehydrogenase complex dihydrolipoyllysine-residue succinyltransferase [Acidiferrobacterales bacterium]|nr:2-oxoglutarate dehydrogenase complex dihydrolipoyllysine-residue succinyltransferase [Acidiferrobacterales bacterium]
MLVEVKVPALSESIADATLLAWHKREGDFVSRDENLIDIETDKVVLELPAPQAGVLARVLKKDGDTVLSNEVIAMIDTEAARPAQKEAAKKEATPKAAVVNAAASRERSAGGGAIAQGQTPEAQAALSPAARKLVEEQKLDTAEIAGSGRGGRVTKQDVVSYMDKSVTPSAPVQAPAPVSTTGGLRPEQRVPMTRLRTRVAERMVQAQHTAAILTTFNDVNMQPVMELRNRYKDQFEKEYNIKLGFMSFFVKAAVSALKKFPVVNASVDGTDIVYHGYFDIGIAISSPRGLIVPIVRDCDAKSFAEIETSIAEFGRKARDGLLSMEDLTGGTFTITNGGIFGSMMSTPILNPPQSAILGMHRIQERPIVESGQIVARPMMYLALSYDHRIIDGREAVLFLIEIKQALEDPARMLLQM